MKGLKTILGYGLLLWLIPFVLAFVLFPLRSGDRTFFESIMAVVLVITVAALARLLHGKGLLHSWRTGLLWLVMCVILDQAFFSWGPQKMSFADYWKDIGFVYLMIPVITWALQYKPPVVSQAPTIDISAAAEDAPQHTSATIGHS